MEARPPVKIKGSDIFDCILDRSRDQDEEKEFALARCRSIWLEKTIHHEDS